MILTNIINDNKVGEFRLDKISNYIVIKLNNEIINPSTDSVAEYSNLADRNYSLALSVNSIDELINRLFVGPNKFKINEELMIKFDPIKSSISTGLGNQTDVNSDPTTNVISNFDKGELESTAINLGYSSSSYDKVTNVREGLIYESSEVESKSIDTFAWTSNVGKASVKDKLDEYGLIKEQNKFWRNLRKQVLNDPHLGPAKNLPTENTLGNVVSIYSHGEDDPYNVVNCQVYYIDLDGKHKKTFFKLIRTEVENYIRSNIVDGVQVIWVINELKSFLKILWDDSKVQIASIKEAKVSNELPLGVGYINSYLVDDNATTDENKATDIDVLSNDNIHN